MIKVLLAGLLRPALWIAELATPLRRLWAWSRLRQQIGQLPADCVVLGSPEIHGTRQIRCGAGLYVYPGLYLETRGAAQIEIGPRVVLSRGVHLAAHAGIRIGAGTMMGEYSSIRDAAHVYSSELALRDAGHRAAAIEIGSNVWIGRGAIILPGVRIGDRAVIAANSVVNIDVPPDALVGGVPARVIRIRKKENA